jgi:class 3 adenylate cyclase/tetratricopeptide (TPR) repeat protein
MSGCERCGQENPDGFRFCGACGTPLTVSAPARELRKTVTVLFCDVSGSTAMGERLDPESTRRVMARYFDAMRSAIERHGGTVEKFIGDAVMAVFGVPVVHEDDALRAVRAAADMKAALEELNGELERDWGVRLASRIGVNTGEVVTGEGESLATGDAVNVAARLEQAAQPDEILIGEATYRLVRDAVEAEPIDSISAKGKREPVRAFRVEAVKEGAETIPRRLDSPMVGRENELAQLQRAYEHAAAERVPYLFTVLGSAGIGKSRLLREFIDTLGSRATVLEGRCLPYGEGITYWPLVEMFPNDPGVADLDANRDEIALATRRRLEALSRERPLVVVLDDLQWAEPTFLDLVDHVTDLARDAPMLIACLARPDLLDSRRGWGGGKLNATTILLDALTEDEATTLVDNLLVAGLEQETKRRIAEAAEGNPLFVEEMLSMLTEERDGEITVPPTIQALLAARLDRLTRDERIVVECAAVQGQEFNRPALAALAAVELADGLGGRLQTLVRKDLIRPVPGADEEYRFKHLLLRDAAYEAIPKEARAELHEAFADWMLEERPQHTAIVGYHFEQAYHARADLGPPDDRCRSLARRGAELLAAAGKRALDRSDIHATINLLERAVALLPDGDPEAIALYPDLAFVLGESGDLKRSAQLCRIAEELGDRRTALLARMRRITLELEMQAETMQGAVEPMEAAVAEAEHLGDDAILAEGLRRLSALQMWLGDNSMSEQHLRRSLELADAVGSVKLRGEAIYWLALVLLWGPTPVDDALRECEELVAIAEEYQLPHSELLVAQGTLMALTGDFDRGRELTSAGRQQMLELGQRVQFSAISQPVALLELLAGDAPAAERILTEADEILTPTGERGYLSTVCALRGLAVERQGRYDEAEALADRGRELGDEGDLITQIYWRVTKAKVLHARGERDEARRLATETLALTADYDNFDGPMASIEVADCLDPEGMRAALEQARAGAAAKGNAVIEKRARERLAALP